MIGKIYSAALDGIQALAVQVEADVCEGMPFFQMVGFLSAEVREAKERVRTALKNSHFVLPPRHVTVNLSPAGVRKEGTAFDLPVALAVLAANGYIPCERLEGMMAVGELSLDGRINSVNGVLPIVCLAKDEGMEACIVPEANRAEGAAVEGMRVYGAGTLSEVIEFLLGVRALEPAEPGLISGEQGCVCAGPDFSEVNGQKLARRALEVAAAGHHNILMSGPPGAGKTMLARCIPTIMPPLTFDESLELSKIYSVSGKLEGTGRLMWDRPFRAPHHTITVAALAGGGRFAQPGEMSMATHGVLFLDELPEFSRASIETLREPLEERRITVTRMNRSYSYPAGFMLAAAMNPCPCGYYPDRRRCRCSQGRIARYLGKISRPILDRIDICIDVRPIEGRELFEGRINEPSADMRRRVVRARMAQLERYKGEGIFYNSQLRAGNINKYCSLGQAEEDMLRRAFEEQELSARGLHRILKVSRTIADLEGSGDIKRRHIAEAVCYKNIIPAGGGVYAQ